MRTLARPCKMKSSNLAPFLASLLHVAQAGLDGYSEEKLGLQLLKHKIWNDPEALAAIEEKKQAIVSLYKSFPFLEAPFSNFVDAQRRRDALAFAMVPTQSAQANCTFVRALFDPPAIRVSVDIAPQPDTDELNGPRKIMVSSSTAVSASDRNGWMHDRSDETGYSSTNSMSASAATLGGLVAWQASRFQTVHGARRWGANENGENGLEKRQETVISSEVPCPEEHVCQGVTWSYIVEVSGPVVSIPTLDATCLAETIDRHKQSACSWCGDVSAFLDLVREAGLGGNISYAALPRSRYGDPWFKTNKVERNGESDRCDMSDDFFEFSEEAQVQPGRVHQGVMMHPPGLVSRYRYETPETFGHTLRYPSGRMWSTSFLLKSKLQTAHSSGFPSKAKEEDMLSESCELENGWKYAPQTKGAAWLLPPPGQRKEANDGWEFYPDVAEPEAFSEKCSNIKPPPLLKADAWVQSKGWCGLKNGWEFTIKSGTKWFRPPKSERRAINRGWEMHPTWPEPENARDICAELNSRYTRGAPESESSSLSGHHQSELIRDDTPDIAGWATAEMRGAFAGGGLREPMQ